MPATPPPARMRATCTSAAGARDHAAHAVAEADGAGFRVEAVDAVVAPCRRGVGHLAPGAQPFLFLDLDLQRRGVDSTPRRATAPGRTLPVPWPMVWRPSVRRCSIATALTPGPGELQTGGPAGGLAATGRMRSQVDQPRRGLRIVDARRPIADAGADAGRARRWSARRCRPCPAAAGARRRRASVRRCRRRARPAADSRRRCRCRRRSRSPRHAGSARADADRPRTPPAWSIAGATPTLIARRRLLDAAAELVAHGADLRRVRAWRRAARSTGSRRRLSAITSRPAGSPRRRRTAAS